MLREYRALLCLWPDPCDAVQDSTIFFHLCPQVFCFYFSLISLLNLSYCSGDVTSEGSSSPDFLLSHQHISWGYWGNDSFGWLFSFPGTLDPNPGWAVLQIQTILIRIRIQSNQCCWSRTFWYGSGSRVSSVADAYHCHTDPDPEWAVLQFQTILIRIRIQGEQCCSSRPFWSGSGSDFSFSTASDPDPAVWIQKISFIWPVRTSLVLLLASDFRTGWGRICKEFEHSTVLSLIRIHFHDDP